MEPGLASRISRSFLAAPASLAGWILVAAGICVLPWAVLCLLLRIYLGASLADAIPGGGDFILYWHEIATYAAVGFKGGYYGFEELVAPASRLGTGGFGAHSAFFPMLFGSVGVLLGWGPSSGTFYGLGAVSIGVAGFVLLTWRDRRLHLLAGALLLTNVYIYCYLAKCSPEGIHVACAFLLAGLFIRYFEAPSRARTAWFTALYGAIMVASLIRYSWGLAFVPLFFSFDDLVRRPTLRTCVRAAACLSSIAAVYFIYNLFMAPYPYEPFTGSIFGLPVYVQAFKGNFAPLLRLIADNFRSLVPSQQQNLPSSILYVYLVYMAITTVTVFLRLVDRSQPDPLRRERLKFVLFFMLATMVPLLVLCLCYYYISVGGIGAKILLPSFLMSYLITARYMPVPSVPAVLAIFLGLMPMGLQTFQSWNLPDYDPASTSVSRAEAGLVRKTMGLHAAYQPGDEPWCNTLVTLDNDLPSAYMGVPPGIAIQVLRYDPAAPNSYGYSAWHAETGILSRWIVTKNSQLSAALSQHNRLVFLGDTPLGKLYRNDSSPCGERAKDRP